MTFGSEVSNFNKWVLALRFQTTTDDFRLKVSNFNKLLLAKKFQTSSRFSLILNWWTWKLADCLTQIRRVLKDKKNVEGYVWKEMTWLPQSYQLRLIDRCRVNCLKWNGLVVSLVLVGVWKLTDVRTIFIPSD